MPTWQSTTETFNTRTAIFDDERNREYVRTFDVIMDSRDPTSRTCDQFFIISAPGLPRLWTPYITPAGAVDLLSWVRRVNVKQDTQDPYLWRVEVQYSNKVERPDINQQENPLLRPAEISYDTEIQMVATWNDEDGNAILNAAGDPFDPPLEREVDALIMTVELNQLEYAALNLGRYRGKTNSKPWLGFQRGQVLLKRAPGKRVWENGLLYWKVVYEFHIRFPWFVDQDVVDVWAKRVLNQGFRQTNPSNPTGKPVLCTDPLGKPVTSPVPLDKDGYMLLKPNPPVFLTFYMHGEADFNELNLV